MFVVPIRDGVGGGWGWGLGESRSTLIVRNVVTMAVQHSAYVVHRSAAAGGMALQSETRGVESS